MSGNKRPLISFCCLSYKHEKYIKDCISSIWALEEPDMEIIALDDGSPDNSARVLRELQANSPCHFEFIHQANSGNVGGNFNRLIKRAQGKYISFISCDDALEPAAFSRMLSRMKAQEKVAFITSTIVDKTDAAGNVVLKSVRDCRIPLETASVADIIAVEYKYYHSFYLQGSIFSRKIVNAVGGFDEKLTGDDIILRNKVLHYMLEHPDWKFDVVSEATVRYRHHDSNVHYNIPRQIKTVTEFLEKFHPDKSKDPAGLTDMAEYIIKSAPLPQVWEIFTYNRRAAAMLLQPYIQNLLIRRMKREPDPASFGNAGICISVNAGK